MTSLQKKRILRINSILTSLIAALGVVGCTGQKTIVRPRLTDSNLSTSENQIEEVQERMEDVVMCMYGVPRAQYIVSGIVTDSAGIPLTNQEIQISVGYDKICLQTDSVGEFSFTLDGFPLEEISFGIDGKQYIEKVIYDGEPVDAWNRGTATMQIQITHTKNTMIEHRPQLIVKYGVPPIVREK